MSARIPVANVGERREVAKYECGCRVFVLTPNADVMGGLVERCAMHAAARDMLAELRQWLARHVDNIRCEQYERGAIYEKGPRPQKDGRYYFFAMAGPEGMGYYPCRCNTTRALLAKIDGGA